MLKGQLMSLSWIKCIVFALTVLLALSVFAETDQAFECTVQKNHFSNNSKFDLKFSTTEKTGSKNIIGVELSMDGSLTPKSNSIKTYQNFKVEKAENEVLFENVNSGNEYWIVNPKNGSSVRKKQIGNKIRNYQFYLQEPSNDADRIIVDLSTANTNGRSVAGTAEVFLHRKNDKHSMYIGKIPVECKNN